MRRYRVASTRPDKPCSSVRGLDQKAGKWQGRPPSCLKVVEAMEELGRGGRLRGGAASDLVAAAYAAESAHGPRLARGLSLADLAHAVALIEGGDLAGEEAGALVRGLLELHAIPGDEFPWDPSLGDAFNAREAELERRVGRSGAGWRGSGRAPAGG